MNESRADVQKRCLRDLRLVLLRFLVDEDKVLFVYIRTTNSEDEVLNPQSHATLGAKYPNCTLYIVNRKSISFTSSLVFRSSYILIRHSSNNACVAGVRIVEWAHEQT